MALGLLWMPVMSCEYFEDPGIYDLRDKLDGQEMRKRTLRTNDI